VNPSGPILVTCASRDRPDELLECVQSFVQTSNRADIAVFVDADQIHQYLDAYDWTPYNHRIRWNVDKRMGPVASNNYLYEKHKHEYRIFGTTPDDSRFAVKGWDGYVIDTFDGFIGRLGVVSPATNDGDYCTHPYVSREWIEEVGWYAYPQAYAFIWDTVIEMLGEATQLEYAPPDRFRMMHRTLTSSNSHLLPGEAHSFLSWCAVGRRAIVKRIRAKMKSIERTKQDAADKALC
jgi:hypothetical protein